MTTENNFNYEEFADATPAADTDDKLTSLSKLGMELVRREKIVADAEAALQTAKMNLADLTERAIPTIMASLNMTSFKLASGHEIEIKPVLAANISEDRRDAAHAWLEDNGEGGVIKRRVVVAFSRDQEKQAAHLIRNLEKYKTPMPFSVERKVEPATLKKLVKERLQAGELPEEARALLGVFEKKVAEVKTPGVKKSKGSTKSDPF